MKIVKELLNSADSSIRTTDHLIYSTYPIIRDSRLLVKIIERINDSFTMIIDALLRYERLYKRISSSFSSFGSFTPLQKNKIEKIASKYSITKNELKTIGDISIIIHGIKESSIRLNQKDKVTVFSNDFRQQSITIGNIKEFFNVLKNVNKKVKEVILKDPLITRL